MTQDVKPSPSGNGGLLNLIERVGNKLPDPATLFIIGTVLVMVASAVVAGLGWTVPQRRPFPVVETITLADGTTEERAKHDAEGNPVVEWREVGEPLAAKSLLSREGVFWIFESMVRNFTTFPPLGIVLVGMLGIGVAERTGLIAALLKGFMLIVPGALLTPAMVFVGIMSSLATDAGYVVLPPLAAALYKAVGRSPLAGIAAVFAGVAAGFNANLLITSLDPLLAGLTTQGAQVVDPDFALNPACNWSFMVVSTFVITLAGWFVTAVFVERRLNAKSPEDGGPLPPTEADLAAQRLTPQDIKGMIWAAITFGVGFGLFLVMILIPDGPLHGQGVRFARWAEAIVPMIFLLFMLPGLAFGMAMGTIRNDKDLAKLFVDSMAGMAPIIVLAFFAGQFIKHFDYSGLDKMLAMWGGQMLGEAQMPAWMLIVAFILVTLIFNLFVGSMSAKWTIFAPIFVPMFMMVGLHPALTQAAYRIGDSVTNIITPLNAYLIIILVYMQKFVPRSGMGTLISTMLPYSVVFAVVWTMLLVLWMAMGIPLGPGGELVYAPAM